MSLTRSEWLEMWVAISKIELYEYTKKDNEIRLRDKAIKQIKKRIQQVIGQME